MINVWILTVVMASGSSSITNFQYKFDSLEKCISYKLYSEKQLSRDAFNGYYIVKGICVQAQEQKIK